MTDTLSIARGLLLLAFTAGRWRGQVDLEEHYDHEQYGIAFVESMVARKTCKPCFPASTNRTVTVNLRSDMWRKGVAKTTDAKMNELFEQMEALLELEEGQNDINVTENKLCYEE